MTTASINPMALGAPTYQIVGSTQALVSLELFYAGDGVQYPAFTVSYPNTVTPKITLIDPTPKSQALLPPLTANVTYANLQLDTTVTPDPSVSGNNLLTCYLTPLSSAANATWTVMMSVLPGAATNWSFAQQDNTVGTPTVTLLVCDPVAQIASITPSPAPEQGPVSLVASDASVTTLTGATVVPTTATVTKTYTWTYTGSIAIPSLASATTGQTATFTAPGVYGNRDIAFTLTTQIAVPGGQSISSSTSQTLTIQPRVQHMVFLLDRSGSMAADNRWSSAVTGTRMLCQLYSALRGSVSPDDQIGVVVFEDSGGVWTSFSASSFSPDPLIAFSLVLQAGTALIRDRVCTHSFGNPGTFTPIGDALVFALTQLNTLYTKDPTAKFNVVLFTDGYENSGSVYLDPISLTYTGGATPAQFSTVVGETVGGVNLNVFDTSINGNTTIYAVGLGPTVQDDVLNQLTWPGPSASNKTLYRNITDPLQLKNAFADVLGVALGTQSPATGNSPAALGMPADPDAPSSALYFQVNKQEHRVILAIEGLAAGDTLQLALYDTGTSKYVPLSIAAPISYQEICPPDATTTFGSGFMFVDLEAKYTSETLVPVTNWRLEHLNSASALQPITPDNVLVYIDLHVMADVRFDKLEYRTGDEMVISARLMEGSLPIVNAKVTVELARPGQSLGTFLATNNTLYDPAAPPPHPADPPPPKQAMTQQILVAKELSNLTVSKTSGIFSDGTNQLFDDGAHHDGAANDGLFANVFSNVDQEGTYTFRVVINGRLRDGSPFSRIFTKTTWAGIRVDPASSTVTTTSVAAPTPGKQAVKITILPKDRGGQYLGPFRDNEVTFTTSLGTFPGKLTGNLDGSYTQILEYDPGQSPVVTPIVQGNGFPPVTINPPITLGNIGATILKEADEVEDRIEDALKRLFRAIFKKLEKLFH